MPVWMSVNVSVGVGVGVKWRVRFVVLVYVPLGLVPRQPVRSMLVGTAVLVRQRIHPGPWQNWRHHWRVLLLIGTCIGQLDRRAFRLVPGRAEPGLCGRQRDGHERTRLGQEAGEHLLARPVKEHDAGRPTLDAFDNARGL
jgi:hypothetical protein